jgi:hypothetical protein
VEECINHPSYNPTKITFNDLIQMLNQPRENVEVSHINSFRALNPYKKEQDFLTYHLFFNLDLISFFQNNLNKFFVKFPNAGEPKEDEHLHKSRIVDQVTADFIEFLHKKKENSEILNRILYYLEPVHRFLSLSGILLNFQSRVVNELNPLRKSPSTLNTPTLKKQKSSEINQVYIKLKQSSFETTDLLFFKDTFKNNQDFKKSFEEINWNKFSRNGKIGILLARVLHVIFSYQYSTLKPFEGIKSLAVMELLNKENTITFPGIVRVKELFFEMDSKMGFVKTAELLIKLMNDEQIYHMMCDKIRKPIKELDSDFDFFDENLNELLQRIELESEKYIDWDEFSQYFSYRGKLFFCFNSFRISSYFFEVY